MLMLMRGYSNSFHESSTAMGYCLLQLHILEFMRKFSNISFYVQQLNVLQQNFDRLKISIIFTRFSFTENVCIKSELHSLTVHSRISTDLLWHQFRQCEWTCKSVIFYSQIHWKKVCTFSCWKYFLNQHLPLIIIMFG